MGKQNLVQSTNNAALANIFAPQALKFGQRNVDIGETWGRVYAIINFPPKVKAAWIAKAANLPGVCLALHGLPTDPTNIIKELNRSISLTAGNLESGGNNALTIQRLEAQLTDASDLMRRIDQEQQSVFTVGVFLLVTAKDEAIGLRRAKRVEGILSAAGMRARVLSFRQEDGMRAVGPWGIFPKTFYGKSPYQMPSETLAASFPFSSGGINHGKGIALGTDSDDGLVLVDRWDLTPNSQTILAGVTNRNWTILATSGAGKTWTTILMMLREYAQGVKVIVIDPEREYRDLCRKLGGTWINTTGGGNAINPFQATVGIAAEVDEDTDDKEGTTAMTQHIQRLRTFFNLYLPQLSDIQRAYLRRGILATYKNKGITIDTNPATVDEWPTITDLYNYCVEKAKDSDNLTESETWSILAALLEDAATGIDSRIWCGGKQPDITDVDFLVLDIHDLQEAEDSVQRSQYFNVLGYAWDILRRDRSEKVLLVVDEAWLLVDPTTPQALTFLKKMAKRIRKYSGSLNVVTQNPIDFLDPAVAREGEPVLSNSSTKFLLRQEAKDLPTVAKLFSLSDTEQDKLATARQGEGLLISGNARAWVKVETAPHETILLKKKAG